MRIFSRVFLMMLVAGGVATGAVVHVVLPEPNGFFGIGPGNPFTKSFDFDGNGTVDLEFQAGVDIFGFYVVAPPTTRIVHVSLFGVLPMPAGEEIGSILGSTSHPQASLFPHPPNWTALVGPAQLSFVFSEMSAGGPWHPVDNAYGENAYLGFEFQSELGPHYGWIHIQEFAGVGGWFYSYAYESTPGASIRAGQIPEPSSLALLLGGMMAGVLRRHRKDKRA